MANSFRLHSESISVTTEEALIKTEGSSNFIVGSVIITNIHASTDGTVSLSVYDADKEGTFYILKNEPMNHEESREILSRPFVLETDDELRITCSDANVYDVLISYLDRDRD
jgi:hypothetical protein|tara:strand:+ start:84 stop:419 length:336 start_codon:yes stop_codon:yes gene_type:complete